MTQSQKIARGLIVDDDKNIHEILTEGLTKYVFDSTYNITSAKKKLNTTTYAFVLLDYRLRTQSTGLELVDTIKKKNPLALIILMSAYGTKFVLKEAIDYAIDTYVDKPIILKPFEEKITNLLKKNGLINTETINNSITTISNSIQTTKKNIKNIKLKEYAETTNKNYKYLSQKFKKETGITFQQMKQEETYNTIKQLLSDTTLTNKEISNKCGFANQSACMRGFKNFTGQTMGQYRRSAK